MQKPVTLKDIAIRLSVSTVTVSKALSGKDGVSDELRQEIIKTAKEMGYRKNLSAKNMRDGKTNNVGILICERHLQNDDTYTRLQQQISKQLLQRGYYAIAELISTADEELGTEPRLLADNKVDALILLGQMRLSYVQMARSFSLPTLFVDFFYENLQADAVICDNLYGGYSLTSHLIQLGHSAIAFVGNPMFSTVVMDRYLGYYKALMESGIASQQGWVINDSDEFGTRLVVDAPIEGVTAYVCSSCESAYRLIQMLEAQGLEVPAQISVVGFDEDLYASLSSPPLTTFSVDPMVMAQSAAQSIIAKLENPRSQLGRMTISGELHIRHSSGPNTPKEWSRLNRFG
ncbi:MAG: substrate-binding domain-containing protein [Sphaerochaeta sp.]